MKKISKILSTLLAVCMIVTMMATPVMANTGNVLEVGTGKTYTTLAAAVVAANAGDTIKLFEDIAITETCTIDKNITVDFNTYHINISGISEAAYSGIKIVTGATVTFNGTGGINAETNCVDNQGGTIVFNGGHYTTSNINRGTALNIDAGTVTVNTGVSVDAARFAVYNEVGATCILKGGTLVSRSHNGVGNYSYCVKNAGTMEIYDGVVIRGIQGGLAASGMGTTTVYGGTIETYEGSDSIGKSFYACYAANNANLTILGGSFTAAKRASLYIGNEDIGLDGAKVVIKGGTFTSNGGAEAAVIQADVVGDLLIYGGTFGSDVSKYVSIGYYQKQNDDKTYTVEIMPVLNATTNTRYPDIEEAAKAAKNGEIIHVYPGDYNIMRDDVTLVEGQAGWYLPITTSISIIGVDENGVEITDPTQTKANIYSVDYKANGAHASQDLMSIFADNVIVKGLTIMNKVEANKG
ncbi:MAG: hypothetical protein RR957_03885, partial [Oscillospiraceae bacterium]